MLLPALTAAGVAIGGVVAAAGGDGAAVWRATAVVVLVPLAWSVVRTLGAARRRRRHRPARDRRRARARRVAGRRGDRPDALRRGTRWSARGPPRAPGAHRAARRAPRFARLRRGGELVEVAVDRVVPGDLVLVRAGEVLPVDGIVESQVAVLDESALTGEPLPRRSRAATPSAAARPTPAPRSTCGRPAPPPRAPTRRSSASSSRPSARRAPFVRMADRYAVLFLPVTLVLAASPGPPAATRSARWPCSSSRPRARSSSRRRSRSSRASRARRRRGVIVKGAPRSSSSGRARTVLLDKTGHPHHRDARASRTSVPGVRSGARTRCSARGAPRSSSCRRTSRHGDRARGRGPGPGAARRRRDVEECPATASRGRSEGRRVVGGISAAWLRGRGVDLADAPPPRAAGGRAQVRRASTAEPAGAIVLADRLRPDAPAAVARCAAAASRRIAMVTGDDPRRRQEVARRDRRDDVVRRARPRGASWRWCRALQADRAGAAGRDGRATASTTPRRSRSPTSASRWRAAGATASSEAADVVITVDRVERVADALQVGRRSRASPARASSPGWP